MKQLCVPALVVAIGLSLSMTWCTGDVAPGLSENIASGRVALAAMAEGTRSATAGAKPRVYCAGPMSSTGNPYEMATVAGTLEEAGFDTFLPQRDGIEGYVVGPALSARTGAPDRDVWGFLRQAIFSLDVYQVLSGCDGMVVNLNGEVPDEGAVVEMTLAAFCGKPLVALMDYGHGNPMVTGLVSFRLVHSLPELPQALREAFAQQHLIETNLPPILTAAVEMGRKIAPALKAGGADKAEALAPIFEAWRAQQGSAPERSAPSPDYEGQGGGSRH